MFKDELSQEEIARVEQQITSIRMAENYLRMIKIVNPSIFN